MTLLTKQEIEALLDGTTPGPWELDGVRPHTAHVWPVDGCDDPITGEIDIDNAHLIAAAPDLARTVIALHAQLADAKAAQAMVVERAAEIGADIAQRTRPDGFPEEVSNAYHSGAMDVVDAIRALADTDGIEALAALRAERALLRADRDSAARMWQASEQEREAAVERSREASQMLAIETNHAAQAESDRDRLAAANAALEAQVARLVGALNEIDALDPEHLIDGCSQAALRGLVLRMGEIARAALAEVQADARREGGE